MFGFLTVLRFAGYGKDGHLRWQVRCKCRKEWIVAGKKLTRRQGTRGCRSCSRKTHGLTWHPLYAVWLGMKARCYNSARKDWKNYGGRGIKVSRWWLRSFGNFWGDMSSTYKPGLSIDRIDNNGNYSRTNCRWATREEQNSNTRRSLPINIAELSRQTGIAKGTLYKRYHRGVPLIPTNQKEN